MLELIDRCAALIRAGRPFALAVIASASGSSPREVGSGMLVVPGATGAPPTRADAAADPDRDAGAGMSPGCGTGSDAIPGTGAGGSCATAADPLAGLDDVELVGSLSGGCVESAVIGAALEALADGRLRRVVSGPEGDVFAPALTCGGLLDLLVVPVRPGDAFADALLAQAATPPGRRRIVVPAVDATGTACPAVVVEARPRPTTIIVGAEAFTQALAAQAALVGDRVVVCDPRPLFATRARLPQADEIIVRWPPRALAELAIGPDTAVCVLTHDERHDAETVALALRRGAGYVGALGSRRTHERRLRRLRALGVENALLARLHSPIGLDLGAVTPAETAVSIMAEIVLARRGGGGAPLGRTSGPIHRRG